MSVNAVFQLTLSDVDRVASRFFTREWLRTLHQLPMKLKSTIDNQLDGDCKQ
jgi:hypothetical protein